ncbi:hypothetical protein C7M84_024087, partial [Penaeus vannamei]
MVPKPWLIPAVSDVRFYPEGGLSPCSSQGWKDVAHHTTQLEDAPHAHTQWRTHTRTHPVEDAHTHTPSGGRTHATHAHIRTRPVVCNIGTHEGRTRTDQTRDKEYLCILASDSPGQNLTQYFPACNDFIHTARLKGGSVLIHCLAGMSRSVTVAVVYVMCVTSLSWRDSLKAVRGARNVANPNVGFLKQLQDFETDRMND